MVDRVSFERTTFASLPLKFEAGTSNYIGAIGLGEAINYLQTLDLKAVEEYEKSLIAYATELLSSGDGLRSYGTTED